MDRLLERRIADRERAEEACAEATRAVEAAHAALGAAAAVCGVTHPDDDALAAQLDTWLHDRAANLAVDETARSNWDQLRTLLNERSLTDVEADVRRLQERAARLAEGIDPIDLERRLRQGELASEEATLADAAQQAKQRADEARGQVQDRRARVPNVPDAEEALERAEADLSRVRRQELLLDTTRGFLERAQDQVHRSIAPVLAEGVRRWLPSVTGGRYSDVTVDPETLDVKVRATDQHLRSAGLLSHGTAEQVYLLLRATMARHLTKQNEVCPLLLDDVTVHCDEQRERAVLEVLQALSQERQVILFSQEMSVLSWAERALTGPRDTIIHLPTPAAAQDWAATPVERATQTAS